MSEYDDRLKRGFDKLEEMGRQDTMLNQKELYPELGYFVFEDITNHQKCLELHMKKIFLKNQILSIR